MAAGWRRAGNALEVYGECHGAMDELGDTKAVPNGGRRRLSTGKCSTAQRRTGAEEVARGRWQPVEGSERHTTSARYTG